MSSDVPSSVDPVSLPPAVRELVDRVVAHEVAVWPHGLFPEAVAGFAEIDPRVCAASVVDGPGLVPALLDNPLAPLSFLEAVMEHAIWVAEHEAANFYGSSVLRDLDIAQLFLLHPKMSDELEGRFLDYASLQIIASIAHDDVFPDRLARRAMVQRLKTASDWYEVLSWCADRSNWWPGDGTASWLNPRIIVSLLEATRESHPDGVFDADEVSRTHLAGERTLVGLVSNLWTLGGRNLQWPERELLDALGDPGGHPVITLRSMSDPQHFDATDMDFVPTTADRKLLSFEARVAINSRISGPVVDALLGLGAPEVTWRVFLNAGLPAEVRMRAGEAFIAQHPNESAQDAARLEMINQLMGIVQSGTHLTEPLRIWLQSHHGPQGRSLGWLLDLDSRLGEVVVPEDLDFAQDWNALSSMLSKALTDPRTSSEALWAVYEMFNFDPEVREGIAEHPNIPTDLAMRMLRRHPRDGGDVLWDSPGLPAEVVGLIKDVHDWRFPMIRKLTQKFTFGELLPHMTETRIILEVMSHYMGEEVGRALLADPRKDLRWRVARYHYSSGGVNRDWDYFVVMAHLACDPEVKVRAAAVQQLPACLLEGFLEDKNPVIRAAVMKNPAAALEVLAAGLNDPSYAVRSAVSKVTLKALAA